MIELWFGMLVVLVMLGALFFYVTRTIARNERRTAVLEEKLQRIYEALQMMKKATGVLSERVKSVEQKARVGEMQLDRMVQKQGAEKNYSEAIKRVKKGADVDELVQHCHLMPNEAQLLMMIHQKKT